ncbi:hypothetical protein DVH05_017097 [Phytophthora capsici]|nr:hypothetical protein DVH05_017097 [Phytophthora capsici]
MPEQAASVSKPTAPETSACIQDPSDPEPPTTAVNMSPTVPEPRPIVPEHSISALSKPVNETPPVAQASEGDQQATTSRLSTVDIEDSDVELEIASPVRQRGRPKVTSKAKKAKRNRLIRSVEADSTLFDLQISLWSVHESLSTNATYSSSAELARRLQVYTFGTKPKPLVARQTSKLPAGKTLTDSSLLTRVLSKDILRECDAKVSALQRETSGLSESDVSVEIISLGVFSTTTLRMMKGWHHAITIFGSVDKTLNWISRIDFTQPLSPDYTIEADHEIPSKLKQLQIRSDSVRHLVTVLPRNMASKTNIGAQIHLLDLAARGSLGDECMYAVMFASTPGVATIDSSHVGVIVNGKNTTDMEGLASLFAGVSGEKVLVPINCNGNHWCAIVIDLPTESIYTYDPNVIILCGQRPFYRAQIGLGPTDTEG